MFTRTWTLAGVVMVALALSACGGGSGVSPSNTTPIATPTPNTSLVPQDDEVIVGFDENNDGYTDIVTLDPTQNPMTITSVLHGTSDGRTVDGSQQHAGQAINPDVSNAIADYLSSSIDLATRTDLDVLTQNGQTIPVTVYE